MRLPQPRLTRGNLIFLALGFAVALVAALSLGVAAQAPAGAPALEAQVTGAIAEGGRKVTYSVTLANSTAGPVSDIFVALKVPAGLSDVKATQSPSGSWFRGVEGGNAVWLANVVPANGRLGPFTYEATVTSPPADPVTAWIRWRSPSEGVATSKELAWKAAVSAGSPRRGCTACHVSGGADAKGRYSLLWEGEERAAARGGEHPTVAPDGSKLTYTAGVETCLQCHKPGTGRREGKGAFAPLSLRDIVHPAHMTSVAFTQRYGGNCFTCHNVAGDGSFQLLGVKVDVNEKGIPDPARLPIPGAVPPSQGKP